VDMWIVFYMCDTCSICDKKIGSYGLFSGCICVIHVQSVIKKIGSYGLFSGVYMCDTCSICDKKNRLIRAVFGGVVVNSRGKKKGPGR